MIQVTLNSPFAQTCSLRLSILFMETTILLSWAIWTTQNALIFNDIQPEIVASRRVFDKEIKLLTHRVSARSSQAFDEWLQQIT